MHKTSSVWDLETLASMVRGVSDSLAEWQIVNEVTGQVLVLEPDVPTTGCVTLTLWEPDE